MSDINTIWVLVFVSFILAGCASITPSTNNLKNKIQPSKFNEINIQSSPLFIPYKNELGNMEKSGALLITDGSYALMHRASLARMAKHSIEIQTYIYKNDIASRVLMHEIWCAAQRGVKIKILIDDNGLDSDYSDVIALNNHENIEVRIFNPYRNRIKLFRLPEMIFDFSRINRRMHNKLFIVDDTALIIGGRNIADNYFDNTLDVNFSDTDALFIGNIALQAKQSFKEYWEYHRAIPVEFLPSKRKMKKFLKEYPEIVAKIEAENNEQWLEYNKVMDKFIDKYKNKENKIYWGKAELRADAPSKVDAKNPTSGIYEKLFEIWNESKESILISSAYFIPGKRGLKHMKKTIDNGVKISILTNSLSSTDVLAVYSSWSPYRDKLIKAGADVYEYKKSEGRIKIKGKMGSGASLHSKTLVFDDKIAWIGSFNLDPRSSVLNTEVVAIFYNDKFALDLADLLEFNMQRAWKLEIKGLSTIWRATEYSEDSVNFGKELVYKSSPDTSWWVKTMYFFAKVIPEGQM